MADLPPPNEKPEEKPEQPQELEDAEELVRDRKKQVIEQVSLGPMSLVGSWFQRMDGGEVTESGLVIAAPDAPGFLLVETLMPAEQRLVRIEDLTGPYRFFDTQEAMNDAAWKGVEKEVNDAGT